MKLLKIIFGKLFYSRYTLVFVNGFLLASILYFYTEDAYEKRLFESLAGYVKTESDGAVNKEEAILLNSVHLTYNLGANRALVFGSQNFNTFKSSVIHPVTYDLMTTNGACGSYAYILSRLLNELKVPNRIAQMKVNNLQGGHILVEAKTSKGWVVLDGLYNLYFKRADGGLASFSDVQNNWDFYRTQVPANYDHKYRYEGVRYTNWNKIPVVMPAIKGILSLAAGKEEVKNFSFRTYFLRKFHILFEVSLAIYLILLAFIFRKYVRRNKEKFKMYLSFLPGRKRPVVAMAAERERNRA